MSGPSSDKLFAALDELIVTLNASGQSQLAAKLHHRVHQVAWTSRAEMVDELRDVLSSALGSREEPLSADLKDQVQQILGAVCDVLET